MQRRHEANVTQRQLARKCGRAPATSALLEAGTSATPPLKTCERLAVALRLEWNEVLYIAFAARLKTWLEREGYSGIPEAELIDIAKRIEAAKEQRLRESVLFISIAINQFAVPLTRQKPVELHVQRY